MKKLGVLITAAFALGLAFALRARENWPPRKSDFNIPIQTGPEGNGAGVGYYFHDLFGEPSRDLLLHDLISDTAYTQYMVDFQEPDFILKNSRLSLRYLYLNRTGIQFFGIGNHTEFDDGSYYGAETYIGRLSYEVRFRPGFGLAVGGEYHRTVNHDGRLKDPEFQPGADQLERPFSQVYPALFRSDDFRFREFTHNWFVTAFHDNRDQPIFPTRGGYERFRVIGVDPRLGADWSYYHYTAEAAHFFPVPNNYNLLGAYLRWDRLDGRELPFWDYPALGHSRLNLSYYLDGFGLRGYWENRFQDQNRGLGSLEFRHRTRANWFPAEKFNFGKKEKKTEKPRPRWLPEQKPLGEIMRKFLVNSSSLVFVDAGETWSDREPPDRVRLTPGFGFVFYFNSGLATRVTMGFSDEIIAYQLWVDWQAF
jgi:hypothetical protein